MADANDRRRGNLLAEASLFLAVLPVVAALAPGYDVNIEIPEVGFILIFCPALAVVLGALGRRRARDGTFEERLIANLGLGLGVVGAFFCVVAPIRMGSGSGVRRSLSTNNLKQIGLALSNYHEVYGRFPPPAILDRAGRPLYSWRVAILPFLEEAPLHGRFHLDEPWDSPHNRELLARMPGVFASPYPGSHAEGTTTYQGLVGPGTAFEAPGGTTLGASERSPAGAVFPSIVRSVGDFPDGADRTLMVVTARRAVPWSKPEDVLIQPGGPPPPLGEEGMRRREAFQAGKIHGFIGLFADGSVRSIALTTPERILRALFSRNGGEEIPDDEF